MHMQSLIKTMFLIFVSLWPLMAAKCPQSIEISNGETPVYNQKYVAEGIISNRTQYRSEDGKYKIEWVDVKGGYWVISPSGANTYDKLRRQTRYAIAGHSLCLPTRMKWKQVRRGLMRYYSTLQICKS